jgi:hypothetical protein
VTVALQLLLSMVIIAALVVPALYFRKRLPANPPQLAGGVVVAAGVVGIVIVVLVLRAWSAHDYRRRFDTVFDQMCATPAAGDENAQAFHELACSSDTRIADLRGASEYQGAWVHLAARNDKLAVFSPRPSTVPPLAAGKAYHLWLLNATGDVVEHVVLDKSMATLMLNHPKIADAVKAVVTTDAANAAKPSTSIIAQGSLVGL